MPSSMIISGGLDAVAVIRKAIKAPMLTPLVERENTTGIMGTIPTYNGTPMRAAMGTANRLAPPK